MVMELLSSGNSVGRAACGVPNLRLYAGKNAWFLPLGGASHNGMM